MPAVSDWSTTPASNASALGISIAEGGPAANVNNALREMMAELKTKFDAIDALLTTSPQPLDATLTALAALSTTADKMIYSTGVDTFALADLSSFMRTVLDDTSAANACATLGAVRVTALSLANPGYVKLAVTGGSLMVAWGTASFNANGTTAVTYAAAFPTASFAVCSAVTQSASVNDNDPGVVSCSTTGFTAYSAADGALSGFYIAVGY